MHTVTQLILTDVDLGHLSRERLKSDHYNLHLARGEVGGTKLSPVELYSKWARTK